MSVITWTLALNASMQSSQVFHVLRLTETCLSIVAFAEMLEWRVDLRAIVNTTPSCRAGLLLKAHSPKDVRLKGLATASALAFIYRLTRSCPDLLGT
jgi:hypothetical protein